MEKPEPIKRYCNGYFKAFKIDDIPGMRDGEYDVKPYDSEQYVVLTWYNSVLVYWDTLELLDEYMMQIENSWNRYGSERTNDRGFGLI